MTTVNKADAPLTLALQAYAARRADAEGRRELSVRVLYNMPKGSKTRLGRNFD